MNKKKLTAAICGTVLGASLFSTTAFADLKHQVNSGETLWRISTQYGASVSDLQEWNNLSNYTIYTGQQLVVKKSSDTITTPQQPSAPGGNHTYKVQRGDTLWKVATQNGLSLSVLKSINNLTSDIIFVGQNLKVGEAAPAPQPDKPEPPKTEVKPPVQSPSTYTVQRGDSLWAIATQHGLSVGQLKALNRLSHDFIYPGQKLVVNGGSDAPSGTPSGDGAFVTNLINEAKQHIGTPYRWAGSSPSGFDCSGFLQYVYGKQGVSIPRTVATIYAFSGSESVRDSDRQIGDLVFFETYQPGASHAGIYLGNGQFIHTGTTNGVEISSMNSNYWSPRYIGTKRITN
ncbi:LysM peptidoglycan-binding domain-containing protein [Halobacillus fulvus]|nr:LysM peptidoglycan-binding domain-containing protein [Halobacillus fulvus]